MRSSDVIVEKPVTSETRVIISCGPKMITRVTLDSVVCRKSKWTAARRPGMDYLLPRSLTSWGKHSCLPAQRECSPLVSGSILALTCGLLFFYGLSGGELWRTESL